MNDEGEEFFPFGEEWLEPILEAVGGYEGDVTGLRLDFVTHNKAIVTIYNGCGGQLERRLSAWGVAKIAEALKLPYPAQQVSIDIHDGQFAVMQCRLLPKNIPASLIVDALKESEAAA